MLLPLNRTFRRSDCQNPLFLQVQQWIFELMAELENIPLVPSYRDWEYFMVLYGAELLGPPRKVLDIGCGSSIFPALVAKLGHLVTTLDFNFATLQDKFAKKLGLSYTNLDGDIEKIQLAELAWDVVTCISVLEHTCRRQEILSALRRAVKPDGLIAITIDFSSSPYTYSLGDPLYHCQYEKYSDVSRTLTEVELWKKIRDAGLAFYDSTDYVIQDMVCEFYTLAAAFLRRAPQWEPSWKLSVS